MGIVYEAEQESLGRRVAVKVLLRQWFVDERQLRRFRREAETAARLHHTNIVPVFGFGRENDVYYYVMQYIEGVGLDTVLSRMESGDLAETARALILRSSSRPAAVTSIPRRPASGSFSAARSPAGSDPFVGDMRYWRGVARIGKQAAEALAYAHNQGTLHRDIKPANLLLDAQGVVWITDFGLAKPLQEESLTRTGDIVGTLRYMAPERFSGEADPRSDIYGLGITLYELIALRPAYRDSDRHRLIRKITHEDPAPLRQLVPGVPRDLETIVLKATARDPDHRYRSAGELADDLSRFLEDRPIRARRISAPERLWRWSRRNKAVSVLGGTSLLLLILTAVIATVGYVRTRRAAEGEARERAKAEATAQLAAEALDKIFQKFAPDRISPVSGLTVSDLEGEKIEVPVEPVLSEESAALLESLLVFYDRLAEEGNRGTKFRLKAARANRRVGDIHRRLGNYKEAKAAYLRALDLYDASSSEGEGGEHAVKIESAAVYNALGELCRVTEKWGQARFFHEKALSVLLNEPPSRPSAGYEYELARTHYCLGRRPFPAVMAGPPPPLGPPVAGKPGPRRPKGLPGRIARPEAPRNRTKSRRFQEEQLGKAIGILAALAAEFPGVPEYRALLARCYRDLPLPPPWGRTSRLVAFR